MHDGGLSLGAARCSIHTLSTLSISITMIALLQDLEAELLADTAVNLVVAVVFGIICAAIAVGRGRSGVGWFFLGFFFSCIALIILLCIQDLKQQQAKEARQRQENRRLREQIAKERQVSDARHNSVDRRLGAHDQALGLDTGNAGELTQGAPTGVPPLLPGRSSQAAAQWFYARDNQRQGPVSAETIQHLLDAKAITRESLVWRQGMTDWVPIRDVSELGGGLS